jgi:hypothetical protein
MEREDGAMTTTEIDGPAFEAGQEKCSFSSGRVSAAGASDAAHFSESPGRVFVAVSAFLRSARRSGGTAPAVIVHLQDSADGVSWASVASFSFDGTDSDSVAVDSPRAYLRASWAGVVGTWEMGVNVLSLAPVSGGGGSLTVNDTVTSVVATELRARAGTVTDLGGGIASLDIGAISVVLAMSAEFDISAEGNHLIPWDVLYDNPWDFNEIVGFPEGLGATLAVDGKITFNEEGIWAYTLQINAPAADDATLKGMFGAQNGLGGQQFVCNNTLSAMTTEVLPMPAASELIARVYSQVAATGVVTIRPYMTLTRLA